jgi:hypothetical protein
MKDPESVIADPVSRGQAFAFLIESFEYSSSAYGLSPQEIAPMAPPFSTRGIGGDSSIIERQYWLLAVSNG